MYSISAPTRDPVVDFDAFYAHRSSAAQNILGVIKNRVCSAYALYESVYADPPSSSGTTFSRDQRSELRKSYRLTYVGNALQVIRDELMAATRHSRCPMCGQREVATLDHYLPQSVFPEYSSFLKNLVPACPQCNHTKGELFGNATLGRFFHPYFDQLPDEEVLVADVSISDTVIVDYKISSNSTSPPDIVRNLSYHFNKLKLRQYFQTRATEELFDRIGVFHMTYKAPQGSRGLTRLLETEATTLRAERGLNSWKTALYNALARSQHFCNGGYIALTAPDSPTLWN